MRFVAQKKIHRLLPHRPLRRRHGSALSLVRPMIVEGEEFVLNPPSATKATREKPTTETETDDSKCEEEYVRGTHALKLKINVKSLVAYVFRHVATCSTCQQLSKIEKKCRTFGYELSTQNTKNVSLTKNTLCIMSTTYVGSTSDIIATSIQQNNDNDNQPTNRQKRYSRPTEIMTEKLLSSNKIMRCPFGTAASSSSRIK